MRGYAADGIGIAAGVVGWLAAGVGRVAASRHRRRDQGSAHGAQRLAALARHAVWGGRHLDPEDNDPHARWLGAGGAM